MGGWERSGSQYGKGASGKSDNLSMCSVYKYASEEQDKDFIYVQSGFLVCFLFLFYEPRCNTPVA